MPISAKESLKKLAEEVTQCKKCSDLAKLRNKPVPGTGSPNAKIIIVGNYPIEKSTEQAGKPFTNDPSGKLIKKIIKKINLSLSKDTYITYLVKCTPRKISSKDAVQAPVAIKPSKKHINNCISFLSKEISIITPHVIISLGLDVSNTILEKFFSLDKKYRSIDKIHMRIFENPSFKLVPFYEPQDVTTAKKIPEDKYIEDFRNLHNLLKVI